ncbi:hypothetical protein ACLKA6_005446 [Drosophila palustris]
MPVLCVILKDNHHQPQHQAPRTPKAAYDSGNPVAGSGATTIHIPLSGNKLGNNGTGSVPSEVNRTAVWQQINKDGISEQLIIPVTVKVRQINGNHSSTNAALSPRLSPMHEADEYNEMNNKTTPMMPKTNQQQQINNCKEASGKLDAAVVTTQTPANITPV